MWMFTTYRNGENPVNIMWVHCLLSLSAVYLFITCMSWERGDMTWKYISWVLFNCWYCCQFITELYWQACMNQTLKTNQFLHHLNIILHLYEQMIFITKIICKILLIYIYLLYHFWFYLTLGVYHQSDLVK